MKTGIIDEPVNYSKNEDDKLGIKDYAYALKTFIKKQLCWTQKIKWPRHIKVQEWVCWSKAIRRAQKKEKSISKLWLLHLFK